MDYFSDLCEFVEFYEDQHPANRVPKRYMRDMNDLMERYSDEEFRTRFRFHKETVLNQIVPLLDNHPANNRGLPVDPVLKALILLRFYATGSFQRVTADLYHVSQSTVHRVVKTGSTELACHVKKFIRFPTSEQELNAIKTAFYKKASFPGVVALVDGTQIPIISPGGTLAETFRNRKGYFSINVQVVGGPNEEIFDLVARWPGSAHDSRIFDSSGIRVLFSEKRIPDHLLGDSGYPQREYIFTPIRNPQNASEERYNNSLKITRSLIERTIGRWKRRFPCIYFELQTKLENSLKIITATAVLYNIGIRAGDNWDFEESIEDRDPPNATTNDTDRGNIIRRDFILRHF